MKKIFLAGAIALSLTACDTANNSHRTTELTAEAEVRRDYEDAKAKLLAKPDSPERTRELDALRYTFERDLLKAYEAALREQREASQASLLQTLPNEPGN